MARLLLVFLLATPLALAAEEPITRLACGSCYKPAQDAGLWAKIAATKPQLFLFMGDNVYADTEDLAVMRTRYDALLKHPGYLALRRQTTILPTWDDHDYGFNDAGADYPQREGSQKIFLDSFEFPADHPARATPGIYHSWIGGPAGKRLQVILLDTRYFRSPIARQKVNKRNTYVPNAGPGATMLGEAQWKWLAEELRRPADLRLIVSSIQVLTTEHRFEKWANLPTERQRLLGLLKSTGTKRVILLSGDRHLAEFAKAPAAETGLPYDLLELTASGMTHAGGPNDPNRYRVGTCWSDINFATIAIDWSNPVPAVTLAIRDKQGAAVRQLSVTFPN